MNRSHTVVLLTLVLGSIIFGGCRREEAPKSINTAQVEQTNHTATSEQSKGIRIAVGGMITPKEGFAYYREFLDYIGKQLGQPVQYVDAESYEAINHKLQRSEIDAGFVCSGPYVDGKKEFGLELVAAPRAYGQQVYYAYIIVPKNSAAANLDDLKGKRFAFTDPLSNTGKLVPEFMISRKGTKPEQFFSKVVFSGSHDKSISATNQGLVDGASVDSLIWEYTNRTKPESTRNTRILQKSEAYAIPPFVVRPGLDPALKAQLRSILLKAHTTPEGKALLDKMMIDRFDIIEDSAYNSIREMKRHIAKP
jgi:phosphonate transport system substrate-binding protein